MSIDCMKPLTKAEAEVMNYLWDSNRSLSTKELLALYPDPKPALTTVATFLKILEAKGYVEHKKVDGTGRAFVFSPMLSRGAYVSRILGDVKDKFFAGSKSGLLSFLFQEEELTPEEINELLSLINDPLLTSPREA